MKKIKLLSSTLLVLVAIFCGTQVSANDLKVHDGKFQTKIANSFRSPFDAPRFQLTVYDEYDPLIILYTVNFYMPATFTGSFNLNTPGVTVEVVPGGTYNVITPIGITGGMVDQDGYFFITKVKFYDNNQLVELLFDIYY